MKRRQGKYSRNTDAEMWLERLEVGHEAEEVVGPVDLQRLRVISAPQRGTWSTSVQPCRAIPGVVRSIQTSVAPDEREMAPGYSCNSSRASAKCIQALRSDVCIFLTPSMAIREQDTCSYRCSKCLATRSPRSLAGSCPVSAKQNNRKK